MQRIEQPDHRVDVHTARGTVEAKRVVVAAPPPLVLGIDWFPQLPARRTQLLRAVEMGKLMKCDAVYKTPFWRKDGLNGFGINDSGAARAVFDNTPHDGGPACCWRSWAAHLAHLRPADAGQAPRGRARGLRRDVRGEALHPIEYTEHDWTKERWTRGGPTAIHRAGHPGAVRPRDPRPFGHVHWAGTETSTYWTGYMDGAVRSGERAAVEVVERLR